MDNTSNWPGLTEDGECVFHSLQAHIGEQAQLVTLSQRLKCDYEFVVVITGEHKDTGERTVITIGVEHTAYDARQWARATMDAYRNRQPEPPDAYEREHGGNA